MSIMAELQKSKNKADKLRKSGKSYRNLIIYSIIIATSLTRRLESYRPIRDKQALYPWLIRHFGGVRLALASKITGRLVFSSVTHSDPPFFLIFFVNAHTLRRVLTKSIFCCGTFCQILEFIVENTVRIYRREHSISNALETVFTATCAVSDFYANKGGFKIVFVITVQEVKLTLLTKEQRRCPG
ncbi:hypothetical protein T4D_12731 [Trichinella pseudospiralis]|uniref:Uncharacterized protein n=1 Tax=Trichinella pseudospiralis TaxID=6337 RepID=A0A0V1FK77_TRIPS|nr:hypothetical protein T4D_12731 [Trichinella pseudospiralis]